tara:strand:- start:878 stop:1237 length:360 start_codon:yes stop_codon:yes gene_type:complete
MDIGSPHLLARSKYPGHAYKKSIDMNRLYVTFVDKEGDEHKIAVNEGDNLLTIAQANDIEMEGKFSSSQNRFKSNTQQVLVKDHVHAQHAMSLSKTKICSIRSQKQTTMRTICWIWHSV